MAAGVRINGDLNNTSVMRKAAFIQPDPAYARRTLAISEDEDDTEIRTRYRPYLQHDDITTSDWVSKLELSTVLKMVEQDLERTNHDRLKVLILYGSLRSR